MLPEEDRVLIKVFRVEKGYGTKTTMNEFMRSSATASLPLPDLKERLIEEWRHIDHCIIDRAVNQVYQ